MRRETKRTVGVSVGAGLFSVAFIAPSAVLPFSDLTPMVVVAGLAVPTAVATVLLSAIGWQEDRDAVRVATNDNRPAQRQVEIAEAELEAQKAGLR